MLCPSCGKSVGEQMRLCDECAALKQEQEARAAQEAALAAPRAETGEKNAPAADDNEELEEGGIDSETRLLLIKAIGAAILVLTILLVIVLAIS